MRNEGERPAEAAVFAAAGFNTAPNFMAELVEELKRRLLAERKLAAVSCALLFPYGDWSAGSVAQLRMIRRDLALPLSGYARSTGAKHIVKAISGTLSNKAAGRLILLGHSAGGAAAVQAAAQLLSAGEPWANGLAVFQIGSPKVKVPEPLRERVCYLYAGRPDGKSRDPVCAIGSWGGWERGRGGLPRWNRFLHAPGRIRAVPIIGGHRDYFRSREPFRNEEGLTNLEMVLERLMEEL